MIFRDVINPTIPEFLEWYRDRGNPNWVIFGSVGKELLLRAKGHQRDDTRRFKDIDVISLEEGAPYGQTQLDGIVLDVSNPKHPTNDIGMTIADITSNHRTYVTIDGISIPVINTEFHACTLLCSRIDQKDFQTYIEKFKEILLLGLSSERMVHMLGEFRPLTDLQPESIRKTYEFFMTQYLQTQNDVILTVFKDSSIFGLCDRLLESYKPTILTDLIARSKRTKRYKQFEDIANFTHYLKLAVENLNQEDAVSCYETMQEHFNLSIDHIRSAAVSLNIILKYVPDRKRALETFREYQTGCDPQTTIQFFAGIRETLEYADQTIRQELYGCYEERSRDDDVTTENMMMKGRDINKALKSISDPSEQLNIAKQILYDSELKKNPPLLIDPDCELI